VVKFKNIFKLGERFTTTPRNSEVICLERLNLSTKSSYGVNRNYAKYYLFLRILKWPACTSRDEHETEKVHTTGGNRFHDLQGPILRLQPQSYGEMYDLSSGIGFRPLTGFIYEMRRAYC